MWRRFFWKSIVHLAEPYYHLIMKCVKLVENWSRYDRIENRDFCVIIFTPAIACCAVELYFLTEHMQCVISLPSWFRLWRVSDGIWTRGIVRIWILLNNHLVYPPWRRPNFAKKLTAFHSRTHHDYRPCS